MRIFKNIGSVAIQKAVATLGIFDGVHLAHQAIISRLKEIAGENAGESVVVTLWPHPRIVLNKNDSPLQLITTLEEKIDLLDQAGVDNFVILPFDKKMADTDFADFVQKYLVEALNIQHLVVGFNHQFGRNREGNYEKLLDLAKHFGFQLERLEPFFVEQQKVSSSVIRKLIVSGDVESAKKFLGYSFYLTGKVVEGEKIGRSLGFPTANLMPSDPFKIIPANGVYAVKVIIDEQEYIGMMNIGTRPTLMKETAQNIPEVHIIGFEHNLYEQEITVRFVKRIRDEKRFNSIDELRSQLVIDKDVVVKFFEDKH